MLHCQRYRSCCKMDGNGFHCLCKIKSKKKIRLNMLSILTSLSNRNHTVVHFHRARARAHKTSASAAVGSAERTGLCLGWLVSRYPHLSARSHLAEQPEQLSGEGRNKSTGSQVISRWMGRREQVRWAGSLPINTASPRQLRQQFASESPARTYVRTHARARLQHTLTSTQRTQTLLSFSWPSCGW